MPSARRPVKAAPSKAAPKISSFIPSSIEQTEITPETTGPTEAIGINQARTNPLGMSASTVLRLQHTLGNQRVSQLIQRAIVKLADIVKDISDGKAVPAIVKKLKSGTNSKELVAELATTPTGKTFLKQMVMQTDNSALGQLAIGKVFGINEVTGFKTPALRLMWPAFEMLPAKHLNSADNTQLQSFVTYISDGNSRANPMNSINHGDFNNKKARVGYSSSMIGNTLGGYEKLPGVHFLGKNRGAGLGSLEKVNAFSHTVLHEVGHAIDSKLNIMTRFGDEMIFGGWTKYEASFPSRKIVEEIKGTEGTPQINWTKKGKKTQWSKELKKQVEAEVDVESDEAVLYQDCLKHIAENNGTVKSFVAKMVKERRIAAADKNRYMALFRVPATSKLKTLRNMGESFKAGWNFPMAELEQLSINGRMYHRAYGNGDGPEQNNWVSYNLAARKKTEISAYQWRAPGEWFAEIYAAYFEKALSPAHPAYDWVTQFLSKNDDLNPEAVQNPTEWKKKKEDEEAAELFGGDAPAEGRGRTSAVTSAPLPPPAPALA